MAEYVDREAAIDALDMLSDKMTAGGQTALQQGIDLLKDMYAADVQPVVRGKWVRHCVDSSYFGYDCSNCGSWYAFGDVKRENFCGFCGADMREES